MVCTNDKVSLETFNALKIGFQNSGMKYQNLRKWFHPIIIAVKTVRNEIFGEDVDEGPSLPIHDSPQCSVDTVGLSCHLCTAQCYQKAIWDTNL